MGIIMEAFKGEPAWPVLNSECPTCGGVARRYAFASSGGYVACSHGHVWHAQAKLAGELS